MRTCWFRHEWGKWSTTLEGNISLDGKVVGKVVVQLRTCKNCDKVALHKQEWRIGMY